MSSVRRAAVVARRIRELRCIAQLERVKPKLRSRLPEDWEALEDGEIVLNVSGPSELVSSRIAHIHVLWCAAA